MSVSRALERVCSRATEPVRLVHALAVPVRKEHDSRPDCGMPASLRRPGHCELRLAGHVEQCPGAFGCQGDAGLERR